MDDTRVNRYKEYRQSFIKEGSISIEGDSVNTVIDINATTSTLPMEQVITAVQEEERQIAFMKSERRKNHIKLIVKFSVAVLVVAGLVVLGIFAWRK